ncbi:MAG: protein-tyrosine phosphatase family protein, partial [Pseudomonadota bacterium]
YLDGEVTHLHSLGVTMVVSLLDELNTQAFGLQLEDMMCRAHDIAFIHSPIRDRSVPSSADHFIDAVSTAYEHMAGGGHCVAHCWAGIGRTGLFAASMLVRDGSDPQNAFRQVSAARGEPVPDTVEQVVWLEQYAQVLRNT